MSGEEILQQWLTKHPEVVEKYQEIKAKGTRSQLDRPREKDRTGSKSGMVCSEPFQREDATLQPGSNHLVQTDRSSSSSVPMPYKYGDGQDVPAELQPFKDILPPSLLPLTMRSRFPTSSSTVDWGNEY